VKSVLRALVVAGIVLGGASAARAEESVVAKVPFAFVVAGVQLPAGDYVISRDVSQPELMAITHADGGRTTTLTFSRAVRSGGRTTEQPKLEFARVGTQVYLTQVTLGPGNTREIALPNK
jgi:hypothetical protein